MLRVLVIGLDPYRVPGPWDPEPVALAIEHATARFAEDGYSVSNCLVGLDGSDDIPAVVRHAIDQGGPWDCVLVGGGIRHNEELVVLFETIINLVHELAPEARIAFNHSPNEINEAVVRVLRQLL